MKRIMMVSALAAIVCGCVSVNQNDGGNACRKPCIVKDIVHEKFTVAKHPVQAQDHVNCLFGFITWGSTATHTADAVCGSQFDFLDTTAIAKNGAYANACDAANCDQVVGAKYKVTTKDYFIFKSITVEITGYPATLSGVEVIENTTPCACRK